MHKHPPPISGGYWRRLKKKESSKGFTLVELIVVIVILAILAAILIPGLLKWIDQARDKKYELEAREIALAAEAALAKVYAAGSLEAKAVDAEDVVCWYPPGGEVWGEGSSDDWMKVKALKQELEKFTDADVKKIRTFGAYNYIPETDSSYCWDTRNIEIYFVASDGVNVYAKYMSTHISYATNGWEITKNSNSSVFN